MIRKRNSTDIPTYDAFMIPVLKALKELGGSGTIEEINTKVYEIEHLSDEVLQLPHGEKGTMSEVAYRLAWTRTYLKKYGLLSNSARGVWALIKSDINIDDISPDNIVRTVKGTVRKLPKGTTEEASEGTQQLKLPEQPEDAEEWREKLLSILIDELSPSAFERLVKRLLRESGFVQVEVTGNTGDGGIDGKGIVRISGFLSFHVIFQCKKYKGSVSASQIRDFRGAMQGRADKGLFITTGTFTRDALKEATRDGAPPIDLIDGDLLCEKIKELKLGVTVRQVETVDIDNKWFMSI